MGHNHPRDDDEPNDRQRLAADETATTTAVTDDGRTRAHFPARAEYRPGEEVPLRVTLEVPEYVLDVAGGFEELTDTVRLRPAPSGED